MRIETKPEVGTKCYYAGYFKPVESLIWSDDGLVNNYLLKIKALYTEEDEITPSILKRRDR